MGSRDFAGVSVINPHVGISHCVALASGSENVPDEFEPARGRREQRNRSNIEMPVSDSLDLKKRARAVRILLRLRDFGLPLRGSARSPMMSLMYSAPELES